MIDIEKEMLDLQKREAFLVAKKEAAETSKDSASKKYYSAKEKAELYNDCSKLLLETSMAIQETTTDKIAKIVTSLYQNVFQTQDEFVIKVDSKRKTPVAEFFIKTKKDGKEILLDPMDSDGGGKIDVISIGLRLAALLLYKPALHRILVLDEPMRFISSSNTSEFPFRYRAVSFLKKVAEEYNIQIIAVTHDAELVDLADKHYEFSLDKDGYTEVKCF